MDLNRLSLNTATIDKQCNLQQCIDGCLQYNIPAIAPWRHKIAEVGLKKATQMIRNSGLKVSSLCRGGMFPASTKKLRLMAIEDNKKAVDEAVSIGAQCLILVVGGLPKNSKNITDARDQVFDGIANTLEYSRRSKMPLAIEPLHPMYAADRACINTLSQAMDIVDKLGEGIGIALDVYHTWWDPNLKEQIARISNKIIGYHTCDWLDKTESLLTDRGMMGDGIIDIKKISKTINKYYSSFVEVEIFSEKWWSKDPNFVLKTTKERFLKFV